MSEGDQEETTDNTTDDQERLVALSSELLRVVLGLLLVANVVLAREAPGTRPVRIAVGLVLPDDAVREVEARVGRRIACVALEDEGDGTGRALRKRQVDLVAVG